LLIRKTVGVMSFGKAWSRFAGPPIRHCYRSQDFIPFKRRHVRIQQDLDVRRGIDAVHQFHQTADQAHPGLVVVRIGEPDAVQAVLQAPQMLGEPERVARIHRNHLVNAVAENEAAIEHRNAGLLDRHEFAVQIDHRGAGIQ